VSTHPRKAKATRNEPLRQSWEHRDRLLAEYYAVLDADPEIGADLRLLRERHPLAYPEVGPGKSWTEAERKLEPLPDPWTSQDRWVPEEARAAILSFCERWGLPLYTRDVLHAVIFAKSGQPRLAIYLRTAVGSAPPPRDPIVYDPLTESPQDFLARARRHVEGTEVQWKAAGWTRIHPKHKNEAVLRRLALRLYRWALGWKYERIADEEETETGEYVDPETVRSSVREWSRNLAVKKRKG
jgi:hypothetical protein